MARSSQSLTHSPKITAPRSRPRFKRLAYEDGYVLASNKEITKMPPKDVKSAKKLYAKMKKEQKKAGGVEVNSEAPDSSGTPTTEAKDTPEPNDTPEPEVQGTSETPESGDEENSVLDKSETAAAETEAKIGTTSTAVVEPEVEPKAEAEAKSIVEAADEPDETVHTDAGKSDSGTQADSLGAKQYTGSEPTSLEVVNAEVVNAEAARTQADEPSIKDTDLSGTANGEAESDSKNASALEAETKAAETSTSIVKEETEILESKLPTNETQAENTAVRHSEELAALRQENDDLKQYVKQLEAKVQRLEGELNSSRRGEVSLSPQLHAHDDLPVNRNRASSFVEADLYSEAEKVTARRAQMEKWKGYQLDLRPWATRRSFGPVVTV